LEGRKEGRKASSKSHETFFLLLKIKKNYYDSARSLLKMGFVVPLLRLLLLHSLVFVGLVVYTPAAAAGNFRTHSTGATARLPNLSLSCCLLLVSLKRTPQSIETKKNHAVFLEFGFCWGRGNLAVEPEKGLR
jgi:hypothetical protein